MSLLAWIPETHPAVGSRALAVRVNLKSEAVSLVHRPYTTEAVETSIVFRLAFADRLIRKNDEILVLLNSIRYRIERFQDNLPGTSVSPLESVLVDSVLSHRHDHSYLIWWTEDGDVHVETAKPPPDPLPEGAWMGVGVQGLQVQNGKPVYHALSSLEEAYPRSFIGVDPENDIVWLIAFEKITGRAMIDEVVALGIPWGGMLDSGDSTQMILGKGLPGIKPYTGIRNLRPTAGYLAVVREED